MGRRPVPKLPRPDRQLGPIPSKAELLDLMESAEAVLSDIVHRWHDGVPPELRDELNTLARTPLLQILIRAWRLPIPR